MLKGILSKQKGNELIKKYRGGDLKAFEELSKEGLILAISVASKYGKVEDLFIDGFVGWVKALKHFDTKKDHKFSTYATWWIKEEIEKKEVKK